MVRETLSDPPDARTSAGRTESPAIRLTLASTASNGYNIYVYDRYRPAERGRIEEGLGRGGMDRIPASAFGAATTESQPRVRNHRGAF